MTSQDRPTIRLHTHQELADRRALARRKHRRRRSVALGGFVAATVAVLGFLFDTSSSHTHHAHTTAATSGPRPASTAARPNHGHLGLDHRSESRAIAKTLRYTSYIRLGTARRREVALTFDDGPSPYTGQILRILRRTHTPATFFLIGRSARTYPRLVAAEARSGVELGDHTETHPLLSALSAGEQASEIEQAANAIRSEGAPTPRLLRPPYGSFDPATLAILHARRMLMVMWSVDTSDYIRPGVAKIVYTAVSGAQPGAIILMHDGGGDRSETVAALPRIIRRLHQRHFRLVTVGQLVADDPPPASQPAPQPLSGVG